jgi:hypothetical protein
MIIMSQYLLIQDTEFDYQIFRIEDFPIKKAPAFYTKLELQVEYGRPFGAES